MMQQHGECNLISAYDHNRYTLVCSCGHARYEHALFSWLCLCFACAREKQQREERVDA